jgi:predicted dehydrogenase
MSSKICRWRILGAAEIARKNWRAIRLAGNSTLTAVASRDIARCRQFVRECQSQVPFDEQPRAVESYEQLLADDNVDAVYLPLPTIPRKPLVIRAAEAGKHVLAEKPVGATSDDVREMLDACRRNGVQFMDSVMFMHSQRLDRLRESLADNAVGQIRRITSQFSFGGSDEFLRDNIRLKSTLEPLGCLSDLGWYNIRFSLWALDERLPWAVCGRKVDERRGQGSPEPVPVQFSAELFYEDGVSASFYCSFVTEIQQSANISGTRGYVHVPDFVLPFYGSELAFEASSHVLAVNCCDFHMQQRTQRIAVPEYSDGHAQTAAPSSPGVKGGRSVSSD